MDNTSVNLIKKRKLNKGYIVVHTVKNTVTTIKDNISDKKDIYYLVGIDILGKRKVLTYGFENLNNSRYWIDKLENLKSRGVEKILFASIDNNKSLEKAFKLVYLNITIVPSVNNTVLKLNKIFSSSWSEKIYTDFVRLYVCENYEKYLIAKELFYEKYENNKVVLMLIKSSIELIDSMYKYDLNIRKILFAYFYVRDFCREIKKNHLKYGKIDNIDNFTELLLPHIQKIEKYMWCSKKELLKIMDILYETYTDELLDLILEAKK